jgi:hypothetical protein
MRGARLLALLALVERKNMARQDTAVGCRRAKNVLSLFCADLICQGRIGAAARLSIAACGRFVLHTIA